MESVKYSPETEELLFGDDCGFGTKKEELRIVLVGKTGNGKSSTGNTLLGKLFFESKVAASSVTRACKRGTADRFGKKLMVVDTPGLFDTGLTNAEVLSEVLKCIGITCPGPHAILLVVSVGRFTAEERDTVRLLEKTFGDEMMRYVIVVFTRKDALDHDNKSMEDMISEAPSDLQDFLKECDDRVYALNNHADHDELCAQASVLVEMISEMVNKNGGRFYDSGPIAPIIEDVIQERMKMIEDHYQQNMVDEGRTVCEKHFARLQSLSDQEEALNRKLSSYLLLRDQEEGEMKELEKKLSRIKDDAELNDQDEETNIRLSRITLGIERIQREIFAVKREKSEELREEVRIEIENGSTNLLKRFWIRMQQSGSRLKLRIKAMFDALPKKFRRKQNFSNTDGGSFKHHDIF